MGIYPKKLKAGTQREPMFIALFINSQRVEAIEMPFLDERKHISNGILFKLKKEGNSDTCHNMNETCGHYIT